MIPQQNKCVKNENDLKHFLTNSLLDDFYLESEIIGRNLVSKEKVRIDFMARAKPHIITNGFTDGWFGIEVKWIKNEHVAGQINKVFWQSITYSQSVFKIGKAPFISQERPKFVFVFLNDYDYRYSTVFQNILSFCQYSNVGALLLENGYKFFFGGGGYYENHNGIHHKGQTKAGARRYTGNVSSSKIRDRK